ncbi:sortase A [Streptomyces sp. LBL]|uniref:class E sortase n=1 Tax=Streptomyces sp. LBL TaxID=2940562 RepID=UPI0024749BFF|nr:class E sortase [Streptomyces sp. LBL]MDH6626666.1 sortase A [Streptomyces sp. LBL]
MRLHVVHHGIRRRRALRRRALWTGGEVLVTVGVLVLLLVVHQLWWTNREAREGAERKVEALEREWGDGHGGNDTGRGDSDTGLGNSDSDTGHGDSDPGDGGSDGGSRDSGTSVTSASPGSPRERYADGDRPSGPRRSQAYAILTVPRLHLRVPVAEGVSKPNVLNKGYVGHYPGTQQPGQGGNFALAGHRNTHGEPFRYINRLRPKDTIEVETRDATYTYAVDRALPQTSARDGGVIQPIPRSTVHPGRGYTEPGSYLTLTTCTPEYTSRYRLVVWAKLAEVRPR